MKRHDLEERLEILFSADESENQEEQLTPRIPVLGPPRNGLHASKTQNGNGHSNGNGNGHSNGANSTNDSHIAHVVESNGSNGTHSNGVSTSDLPDAPTHPNGHRSILDLIPHRNGHAPGTENQPTEVAAQTQPRPAWKRNLLLQAAVIGVAVLMYALVAIGTHFTAQDASAAGVSGTLDAELLEAENDELAAVLVEPSNTPTPTHTPTPSPTPLPTNTPTATPYLVTPQPTIIPASAEVAAPGAAPLREFPPNVVNVLLIGSDNRPGETTWRSDVIIIASINPDVPSLTMLSIPRDTWVYIPGWRWQRINLAYGRGESAGFPGGGKELLKQTVQYNFGVPIHYIARVDFTGYKHMIDSLGGVDVIADCTLYDVFPDVPEGTNDIITGEALHTVITGTIDIPVAGVYHLDGKHALWFSRSRKTTSDFDRSRRQQRVLRAVWAAAQRQGLIQNLPALWDSMTQTIYTDLTLNDVLYLADVGLKIQPAQMRSRFIDGSMLTWFITEGGANVLRYNYKEIEPYLDETFAPLPANIAAQASTWVDVRNGTSNPDWDLVAVDRLGWEGYNVSSWGQADQIYPHSILIDHSPSPKGSRAGELAEIFDIAPENIIRQPDADSTFAARVIVGEDWAPCQRASAGRFPPPAPTTVPTPLAIPPEGAPPEAAPPPAAPAGIAPAP